MLKRYHLNAVIAIFIIIAIGTGILLLAASVTYRASLDEISEHIENVTDLTSDSIYHRIMTTIAKPVNISLTMANDTLLADCLAGEPKLFGDDACTQTIAGYLGAYQRQFGYEAMFLASAKTKRRYTAMGFDRVIDQDDPEEEWFFRTLADDAPYNINIDTDRAEGADRAISVFINCRMEDLDGNAIGVVGTGYRIDHFEKVLAKHEDEFDVKAVLVNKDGRPLIFTDKIEHTSPDILPSLGWNGWERVAEDAREKPQGFWKNRNNYINVQYIPEISWYLITEHDTEHFGMQVKAQLAKIIFVGAGILFAVLAVLSVLVRRFDRQIVDLTLSRDRERQAAFRAATENLYENIYEFNLTENRAASPRTKLLLKNLGIHGNSPYDAVVGLIAEKQVKESYRKKFMLDFSPDRILAEFESGNSHLRSEFMINLDGGPMHKWVRTESYVYRSPKDDMVYMFIYLKDIDDEKQREIQISHKAEMDEMTATYNKSATERRIKKGLSLSGTTYALFIMDIDNFKLVNDLHGHAFGDTVITEFAATVKRTFRQGDVVGRLGGDEFAAFIPVPDMKWAEKKAEELSKALDMECSNDTQSCKITASIGVALAQGGVTSFEELYRNADDALYKVKRRGKNGYFLHKP